MLRRLLIAALLVCVVLLGSDAYAIACELSCASEARQPQHEFHESERSHSHHHYSNAVSESAHSHAPALQTERNEDSTILNGGRVSRPLAGCAAADRVTLNVQVVAQSNRLSHSVPVMVEGHVSLDWFMTHQTPAEFESPPRTTFAPQSSSTPLRI